MRTLEVRPSAINAINNDGCFALVPFARRKKIAAYAGELVRGRRRVAERPRAQTAAGVMKIITLTQALANDAAVGGDAIASINHSCRPHAFMRVVAGRRVMFFALRDIAAGEEITIDHGNREVLGAGGCGCGMGGCRSRASGRHER